MDLGPKAREESGELEGYRPTAHDHETAWEPLYLLDGGGCVHARKVCSGHGGYDGLGARVYDDDRALDDALLCLGPDRDGPLPDEATLSEDHLHAGSLCHLKVCRIHLPDKSIATLLRPLERLCAVITPQLEAGHVGQEGFRGHAPHIDARAAIHHGIALDERHAISRLRTLHRDGLSRLAKPNDDEIEILRGACHRLSPLLECPCRAVRKDHYSLIAHHNTCA